MWVDPEDDPRDTGSAPRGEKAVLAEYLDHFRMTFEMKCEGLDAEQLAQRSVPPSSMSLLGLVRHLASVEFHWFRRFIEGHMELARPFKSPEDRDLDFNGAVADPEVVAEAWAAWRARGRHAREVYERYDDLGTLRRPGGRPERAPGDRRPHDRGVRAALSGTPTSCASASTAGPASSVRRCMPRRLLSVARAAGAWRTVGSGRRRDQRSERRDRPGGVVPVPCPR